MLHSGGAENELARYEASLDLSDFIAEHSAPDDMVIIGADLCEAPEGKGYDLIASKFKVNFIAYNLLNNQ